MIDRKPERYGYRAHVLRIVDGDTLRLRIDLGFEVSVEVDARLLGLNTPEVHTVKHDSDEYRRGVAARDFVMRWIAQHDVDGAGEFIEYEEVDDGLDAIAPGVVLIRSLDGHDFDTGKYGRWLVEVYGSGVDSLNEALIDEGHAVRVAYT